MSGKKKAERHVFCLENHEATGYVTNQPTAASRDDSKPLRSTYVCAGAECQRIAAEWVEAGTGEPGIYTEFKTAVTR